MALVKASSVPALPAASFQQPMEMMELLMTAQQQLMQHQQVMQKPHLEETSAKDMGEIYVRKCIGDAKNKQRKGRVRLEETLKQSRELGDVTTMSTTGVRWLGMREPRVVTLDSAPRYMGTQANELARWVNAESITRYKEEKNVAVPTLRQVLKTDDDISMKQMTKSQLAALPYDPTEPGRRKNLIPDCSARYQMSWRTQGKTAHAPTV
uniref:Uncharacterized protein n=1 Tax=Alexandrium monilatum TaxID=311494 RepID=A0A7S4PX23_9DINO|mmetsp:Transcript_13910/g.41529  ORF Transcript_13910/g.41529 Transcript_13910/m.41529 type:complete len:209 (-) Transcript_13910:119-745(-)